MLTPASIYMVVKGTQIASEIRSSHITAISIIAGAIGIAGAAILIYAIYHGFKEIHDPNPYTEVSKVQPEKVKVAEEQQEVSSSS